MSSDNINLSKTIDFFGIENIGNIHLSNNNYYFKPINNNIPDINPYIDKYINRDWSKHQMHLNGIYQHHRIMDCYNLLKNSIDFDYDFIIRIRLDIVLTTEITEIINNFNNNPDLELILGYDWFAIGKPKIMEIYCNSIDYYWDI